MQTLEELQQAIQRHESYVKVDPDNLPLRLTLGDLYHRAGRFDEATASYEQYLLRKPGDTIARGRMASVLISQHRFAEAEQSFRALIEGGDSHVSLAYNLGLALYCQHRWEEAYKFFSEAIAGGVVTPEAFAYLARTSHHLGLMTEAIEAGLRWAELAQDAKSKSYLALLYLDNDDTESANQLAHQVLAHNPDDLDANVVAGTGAARNHDIELARKHFETVLRQDRENGRAWLGLGTVQFYQQEHANAIESFGHAARIFSDNPGVIVLLGWAKLMAKDPAGAEEVFERALRVGRMAPEAHGGLASALAFQGKLERAEHEIKLARRLDPNGFGADFAESTILALQGQTKEAADLIDRAVQRSPREGVLPLIEHLRMYAIKSGVASRPGPPNSFARPKPAVQPSRKTAKPKPPAKPH